MCEAKMTKQKNKQKMDHITLHRKLKIKKHELRQNQEVNSSAVEVELFHYLFSEKQIQRH